MAASATPESIRIGEIAIAARAAGYPLALVYHGFPAPVLVQAWKYLARQTGSGVIVINSLNDLRKLRAPRRQGQASKWTAPRLVLVRQGRLLHGVTWDVALGQDGGVNGPMVQPTVFAVATGELITDIPLPRLDLQCIPSEEHTTASWLRKTNMLEPPETVPGHQTVTVTYPHGLERLLWASPVGSLTGLKHQRDCDVVRALLAGTRVWRHTLAMTGTALLASSAPTTLEVSVEDYDIVFSLLRSKLVQSPDDPTDPLAVAMVARANAFLDMLHHQGTKPTRMARMPGGSHEPATGNVNSAPDRVYTPRTINRRELVNLGDPRSEAIRRLIRYLASRGDGFLRFRQLGLVRDLPESTSWSDPDIVEKLAPLLMEWSSKQVRTHFDRLMQAKLITGHQSCTNRPWVYQVPESLETGRSVFRNLPEPASIRKEIPADATTDIAEAPAVSPPCPPLAHMAGQTEVQDGEALT